MFLRKLSRAHFTCAALLVVAAGQSGLAAAQGIPAAPGGAANEVGFAVRNVRIFDGAQVIENGTVVVRGNKITAVGANVPVPAGYPTIDGTGKTLLPGLIESQAHVVDSFVSSSGRGLNQAAAYGITTLVDTGASDPYDFPTMRRASKTNGFPHGADLFTAGVAATAQTVKSTAEATAWVEGQKKATADFIKIQADAPSGTAALSQETMNALIVAAGQNMMISMAQSLDEATSRKLVTAGVKGLTHISPLKRNAGNFGAFLAKAGAFQGTGIVAVAPADYQARLAADPVLSAYMPSFMVDRLKAAPAPAAGRFDNAIANFKALHKAGVTIVAGTDSSFPYQPLLHAELEILAKAGGAAPLEVLKMATANPARAYNLADRGRIAEGLRADLLLVDGNPTRNIVDTRKVAGVWVNGREIDRETVQGDLVKMTAPRN